MDASASGEIRHLPNPLGPWSSTGISVRTFLPLVQPPASPGSAPPRQVSSAWTVPVEQAPTQTH